MRTTIRWIASNIALMILSLTLAGLAWIVSVEAEDPTLEQPYSQPIPIAPPEPPAGMVIVGEFDQSVQVTVRAPESVWMSLTLDDFTATVDLTGLGTGVHETPVQVELHKHPARRILVEPEYVTLELEPRAERSVPVIVRVDGEPALGYIRRATTVDARQTTVTGPDSYVTQVITAVTYISVQDASADVEGEYQLQPLNGDDEPVPYVTLLPETINVRLPIELSGYYRSLAVKVVLEGNISPGYFNPSIVIEPPAVTVFGAPGVIAALPGFIETEPIDVEGAQADVIVRPALNVPQNVAVVAGQQVEVSVFIESIQSSSTVEATPEIQGMEPGFTTTVSPETVEIILSGPLPLLEALEPDDVRVVLDLFGLAPGTHQVEPQVVVPEGATAQSILPATVQVEIISVPIPMPGSQN
ncbi:MAG: hypothetical protein DRJ03_10215 [Chloroflexi bacterium]|nr:MAG: hypothetical protein B6I35_06860 [Anaerolineaceae bacterium 4572_32.2]RLC79414.1 MAG: hypothetical protein DRI81_05350 [Chloroflexota bacterium]RLC85950.1 MAG: hypothetical protein DRJ03_10215 [Chloroflexota bacterium]HEY72370.1 hypothetical protein [Thermoflexia bacterium]